MPMPVPAPAAAPVVELPANIASAVGVNEALPVPAKAEPSATPIVSGSKSTDPIEAIVNAIAPTVAQPPGITSRTPLSS